MKKTLLGITCFFASIISIQAQTLFGTTFRGGSGGGGTINKFITATNNLTVEQSFQNIPPNSYFADLMQAADGKLYGMTTDGGNSDSGTIFSYDLLTGTYTKLHDFDGPNGASPYGSLTQANDGKFYGTTKIGGSFNDGIIFSFDLSTSTFKKLHDFDGPNGNGPTGSLIQASDGKLYGVTSNGGTPYDDCGGCGNWGDGGVIFSYDLSTSTFTNLMDFTLNQGEHPDGGLMQAMDGKLYGVTQSGGEIEDKGDGGWGVIFSFDPSSSAYGIQFEFDPTTGIGPTGKLVQTSDGKFYGMVSSGGNNNGSDAMGVIFSFDPSASPSYTTVKAFDNISGAGPTGSLLKASDGKLYGMTPNGGTNGVGVIFSYDPLESIYTKLKDLDIGKGANPMGSFLQANDGKLYSTAGGINFGVIFSFVPSSSTYALLKPFGADGGTSVGASLVRATNEKLYGMTFGGGSNGLGTIFSFDPVSSTYAKLKDLDTASGDNPYGSLIQATDGKLYGMTHGGGSKGAGVIFSFDPSAGTYNKLKDFDSTNGGYPYGSLMQASDGKLYGMTYGGGSSGAGVIFSFDPSSSAYTKLIDFDHDNGGQPYGNLIQASDGKLYGLTNTGGSFNVGVIFSFDPSSSTYTKFTNFGDYADDAYPYGSLIQASNGKFYGVTYQGGSNAYGVIFSYDPLDSAYTQLVDYIGPNGANPYYGSAFIEVPDAGPLPVTLLSFTGENKGINNQVSWKVGNELNLNYYELQRSPDGQNFKDIAQIKATGNNSYSYNDPISSAVSSLYYYRLKSVDKDGRFAYSVVIKISTTHNGFIIVNPNPFKDKLVVNVESPIQDKATFVITDISGRQLFKENKPLSPGTNIIEINETTRLSKGTYLLTIIESQQTQSIKVVKGN